MSIPTSYNKLFSFLCQALPGIRITQIRPLTLWVWGLLRAGHCNLGKVADQLPIGGIKASRIRRLKRWLVNPRGVIDALYGPLVTLALRRWHLPEMTLVLDRTEWGPFNVLLLGVALLGRGLPLSWTVLPEKGNSDFAQQKALLERVLPWLPQAPKKGILGDGEFKSVALMRYALSLGWDFGLGQSEDPLFQDASGTWRRLEDLKVPKTPPLVSGGDSDYAGACFWTRESARLLGSRKEDPALHGHFQASHCRDVCLGASAQLDRGHLPR